jgi:hypothetical protein
LAEESSSHVHFVDRHLRAGIFALAAFVVLGVVLEAFHAWKAPFYLDAGRETTRLLLRLGHAHGTLIAFVNVGYALVVNARPRAGGAFASACLLAALVLVPLGFLLGGISAAAGDAGVAIVLVPPGAAALFFGLIAAGVGVTRRS